MQRQIPFRILIVSFTSVFLQYYPTTCNDNVLCPPYYTYLESGNDCVFFLQKCGDSSCARNRCSEKSASLVSLIHNKHHFDDLCNFASKRTQSGSSFYLDAYRNKESDKKEFVWKLNNKEVIFLNNSENDYGHDCLEMTLNDHKCKLRDNPCNKSTWTLCEYSRVNPCLNNNGGCEGTCIPRHRGERKCTCPQGQLAIGTKCERTDRQITFTCPPNTFYSAKSNLCFGTSSKKVNIAYLSQEKECFVSFKSQTLGVVSLSDESMMDSYCDSIQNMFNQTRDWKGVRVGVGGYHVTKSITGYENQFRSSIKALLCPDDKQSISNETSFNCILLVVGKNKCCFQVVNCNKTIATILCSLFPPNECLSQQRKFGNCTGGLVCIPKSGYRSYECECPPGVDKIGPGQKCGNICGVNNGGCHHICRSNRENGRQCSCWNDYELYNDTECRFADQCMANDGQDGCPIHVMVDSDSDKNESQLISLPARTEHINFTFKKIVLMIMLGMIGGLAAMFLALAVQNSIASFYF